MDGVLASLAGLPGIESAAYGLTQPFEFSGNSRCCWSQSSVEVDGEEVEGLRIMLQPVSRQYLETLRIPLLVGSMWTEGMKDEQPVPSVISERLAVDVFGSAEQAMDRIVGAPDRLQLRVIGVAADTKHYGLDQDSPVSAYVPIEVVPFYIPMAHMAVRVSGVAPDGLARTLRQAVWASAPDMPIPTVRTTNEWMEASMAWRRFNSAVFAAFGMVALILAAAGLYGTMLYNVRQQRRELGIRLALGAARTRVERQVVGRGLRLAVLGWFPARRAGRTDPLQTLKAE